MEFETDQEKLREKVKGFFGPKKETVSEEIGVNYVYFSQWLNGHDVGMATVVKINKWLNSKK